LKNQLTVLFALLGSIFFIASTGGRNDARSGTNGVEPSCASCHRTGTLDGSVSLNGLPNDFAPNTKYNLSLVVSDPDAFEAGFQLTATTNLSNTTVGTFTPGNNSRVVTGGSGTGRLTQSSPLALSAGQAVFNFCWTSPNNPPTDIIFSYSAVAANNNGSTTGDAVYSGSSQSIPLPLDLISFRISNQDQNVRLDWTTISESNFDKFIIERNSFEEQWEEIGFIKGIGNTTSTFDYHYIDKTAPKNTDLLYRLKVVDLDGLFDYSKLVNTQIISVSETKTIAYPNPVKLGECLFVNFEADKDYNNISGQLIDINGKTIVQADNFINGTIAIGANRITVETASLSPGIYFAILYNETEVIFKERIIVAKQ